MRWVELGGVTNDANYTNWVKYGTEIVEDSRYGNLDRPTGVLKWRHRVALQR